MDLFDNTADEALPFKLPADGSCTVRSLSESRAYRIAVPDGELLFIEHFYDIHTASRVQDFLQATDNDSVCNKAFDTPHFSNINWKQDSIQIYGKQQPLPRLTAWYGDEGRDYRYSGIDNPAQPWNAGLRKLKRAVEGAAGVAFNSVMLNWYRNGEDYLGWHADDEPELGRNPVIASLSFGDSRDFILRHNVAKQRKIILPLGQGSLLIMRGALQHHWQHSVPKRKRVTGSRFNLTFRELTKTFNDNGLKKKAHE